jgi:hypothetical protein
MKVVVSADLSFCLQMFRLKKSGTTDAPQSLITWFPFQLKSLVQWSTHFVCMPTDYPGLNISRLMAVITWTKCVSLEVGIQYIRTRYLDL